MFSSSSMFSGVNRTRLKSSMRLPMASDSRRCFLPQADSLVISPSNACASGSRYLK